MFLKLIYCLGFLGLANGDCFGPTPEHPLPGESSRVDIQIVDPNLGDVTRCLNKN